MIRKLIAVALAATAFGAIGCGGTPNDTDARLADLAPAKTATKLAANLRQRGHDVRTIACTDVGAKRQACKGTVDGLALKWRVDLDLTTGAREVVVTP